MSGRRIGLRKRLALDLFSDLYAAKVREHRLDTLFWECTLRCNLSCRHCGSDCRVDPGVPDMPVEDFLRVLDEEVTPHVDPADVLIIVSGGEVLVREDLEPAGAEITRRGYAWGMVTNGMALTPARLESLLRAGLRSVSVSLDGFEREHNWLRRHPQSYDRALQALRLVLREPQLTSDVVTCVTRELVPQLEAFGEMLIAEGVRHWRIFTIFPAGRARDDASLTLSDAQFRAVLDYIRRMRREGRIDVSYACEGFLGGYEAEVRDHFYQCAAGVSVASVRVDGAISGCTSIRANFHQGNIYRDRFWEVWENRFLPFRNREWARRGECASCRMFKYCLGGGMHLHGDDGELFYCHYKRLWAAASFPAAVLSGGPSSALGPGFPARLPPFVSCGRFSFVRTPFFCRLLVRFSRPGGLVIRPEPEIIFTFVQTKRSMKVLYTALLALLLFPSCRRQSGDIDSFLHNAESLMNEHPEDALSIIRHIDRRKIYSSASEARYALLYSQALDKNYVDVTSDSLTAVAVNYYDRHGTKHERAMAHYYQGRVFSNAGNFDAAIRSYSLAEDAASGTDDYYLLGLINNAVGNLHFEQYDLDEALQRDQQAASFFHRAQSPYNEALAYIGVGRCIV